VQTTEITGKSELKGTELQFLKQTSSKVPLTTILMIVSHSV